MSSYEVSCEGCNAEISVDVDDVLSELSIECECGSALSAYLGIGGTLSIDLCTSCLEDKYNEGLSDGKEEGYDSGYDNGYDEGYNEGEAEGQCCEEGGSEPSPDEIMRIKDLGYEEGYADAQKEFNAVA